MAGSIIWTLGQNEGKTAEENNMKRIKTELLKKCTEKTYILPDAPDIAAEVGPSTRHRMQPTYDEAAFKITKPLANKALPVRQEFVDKWTSSGVPAALQDQFRAKLYAHNAKLNTDGKAWSSTTNAKRPATQAPEGADATEVQPPADGPKSIEDVMKLHGNQAEQKDDADGVLTHIVAKDGSYYIFANKDGVASVDRGPFTCVLW